MSGEDVVVPARILLNHDRGDFTLHMVPNSLIGAMWLQCARVLTVNPTFKQCDYCQKWFELSPDARRRQSKYCSDRCKVAAYRRRRAGDMADKLKITTPFKDTVKALLQTPPPPPGDPSTRKAAKKKQPKRKKR
jgi:hypothetical protein